MWQPLRCVCFVLAVLWVATDSADASDELLQKAKSTFSDVKKRQDEQIKGAFEKAISDATKAGKLEEVEALSRERQVFFESGVLPSSAPMKAAGQKYSRTLNAAFRKLESTFEREIKAETKAEHLAEAKSLQRELSDLQNRFGDAAQDRELIEIVAATWAYDGRFGRNDGTKDDALEKVQQLLKQGKLEIGGHTLGNLSGIAATKSLYTQLRVGNATLNLRLGEGSAIEIGELTQAEAKANGFKIPESSLELLSATWVPQGAGSTVDGTAEYVQRLKTGSVEVSAKSFPNIQSGRIKTLDVTFRIADHRLTIRQSEWSQSSVFVK